MKCDIEKIERYVDGELAEHEAQEVKAHLDECRACRESAAGLAGLDAKLGSIQFPKVSDERWRAVRAGITRARVVRRRIWWASMIAAAAALLITIAAYFFFSAEDGGGWTIERLDVNPGYSATLIENGKGTGYTAIVITPVENEF